MLGAFAEFDPFMSNHIATYGNPGRGKTSYGSSTICAEFISSIAKKVLNVIIDEVNCSRYFSIVVDSTPNISHVDELSFVIRYVKREIQKDTPAEVKQFLKSISYLCTICGGHSLHLVGLSAVDSYQRSGIFF